MSVALPKKHSFSNSKYQKLIDSPNKSLNISPPNSSIYLLPASSLLHPALPGQASQASQARPGQQYIFSYALKEGRARNPLIRVSVRPRLRRPFTFVGPLRSSCMSSSPLCGGFRDLVQTAADVLKSIFANVQQYRTSAYPTIKYPS